MLGGRLLLRRAGPVSVLPLVYRPRQMEAPIARASEETVRGLSAYRRGQRLISRTIGMLPLRYERNGVLVAEVPPLLDRPVPWMARQPAIESMVESLIDWGNYVAVLTQFDLVGRAQGIIPVHPRDVQVALTPAGLLYRIGSAVYTSSDVMHLRTGAPPGALLGWGVLQTSEVAIRTAVTVDDASAHFYGAGVYPSGVIRSDDPDLSQEEADELRARWLSRTRRGEPNVLPAGTEWIPIVAPTAEQAQLSEAANASRRRIADLLDLDGDWLGVPSGSLTYANIVDRLDALVRLTCQPYMVAIEEGFSALTSRPTRVRFSTAELLRGQVDQRYGAYTIGLDKGFLTVDEVRAAEGMAPLPDDVDDVDGVDDESVVEGEE